MSDHPTPASPSIATPTLPSQAKPPCFPLTRQAKVRQQIFGMVLSVLLLALSIAANGLLSYLNVSYVNGSYESSYGITTCAVFPLLWFFFLLILAASSVLCGVLFGSWRGALVSLCAIGGGVLLVHLLNSHFSRLENYLNYSNSNLQWDLIPGPLAALVVGMMYDVRHEEHWGKSMLILSLGMTIALVGFGLLSDLDSATGIPVLSGCYYLFMIPFAALSMLGIERLLQKFIASRKGSSK